MSLITPPSDSKQYHKFINFPLSKPKMILIIDIPRQGTNQGPLPWKVVFEKNMKIFKN